MADSVLKNNFFGFHLFFQQISGTAIGTKFVSLPHCPTERKDLKSHVKDLKGWFLRRDYPQRIVEEQVDKAFRLPVKHDTQQNKIEVVFH